jgi:hypothetical protein
MEDFEKLGAFYLGRPYDLKNKKRGDGVLLYDSKDLVTHAVCVGMTGSGKTGLCIGLLEEAAIDGIPAIAIDPKGDLSNLLLTFPELRGKDFEPWVNAEDAEKKGLSVDQHATQQAEFWKNGLGEWGQSGDRIARLREAADFVVYTPGSNAGIPVSILKSFSLPTQTVLEDGELLRERISGTVTSLLGLLGISAEPLQSREHILISTILNSVWKEGKDLDLAALIQLIQSPPVNRIGVLDLESFYPAKERFGLALQLNNLLASPGFESWLEGEPLDVDSLLYTDRGKPKISIFSISHLGDAERMFFVSLLLNQVLGWVRGQSGTTSLRALIYMDEIFGYFPPVSNPPSKAPLLTLLKQARAFGVGVVLATQNPVDLDYKGLSNAGTWFIGRLQTDRDKQRVLDGLEGAAASNSGGFDRAQMEQILAGLGSRVFLMNNVHEDYPAVFETRWAMSYLRGPLTRTQIKSLMSDRKSGRDSAADLNVAPAASASTIVSQSQKAAEQVAAIGSSRPVLPAEISQRFIAVRSNQPATGTLVYKPMLFGSAEVYFLDSKSGVDTKRDVARLVALNEDSLAIDWVNASESEMTEADLEPAGLEGATFDNLPPAGARAKSYETWKRSFQDSLFRNEKLELLRSPNLKQTSNAGESERDFRVRLQQFAREERDKLAEKLRQKYAPKMRALEDRIRRAQQAVERESEQAKQQKFQTAISFGTTLLSAFVGRKAVSASSLGRATTAARGASRMFKESQDVARAGETVDALNEQLAELEQQFKSETRAIEARIDPATEQLDVVAVKPKKTNITVRAVLLSWAPYWVGEDGTAIAAWE